MSRDRALPAYSEGDGPPLIMLGGGTTGAEGFSLHARALAHEFRVVRLQTLNVDCARRRRPLPLDYSIELEARGMRLALDRQGLRKSLNVMGHSLGALVALDFALDHPRRVRALVLSEPPAFWIVPEGDRRAEPTMRMAALVEQFKPSIEPTDEQLTAFLRGLGEAQAGVPEETDPAREAWNARRRCLRGLSAVADHVDDVSRLHRLRMPVLLVEGIDTVPFHRRINELLAQHLSCASRVRLPGGHGAVSSARLEFLEALRAFLTRTGRETPR